MRSRTWPRGCKAPGRPNSGRDFARNGARGRGWRKDAGQALAEFVLVVPVLLLLVFGIVEFGLAFRAHQIVTNSAREGARFAVLPSTPDAQSVIDVVEARLASSGLDPALADIEVWCVDRDTSAETSGLFCAGTERWGHLTRVDVSYPYTFFVLGGLVRWACGADCGGQYGTIALNTASSMRNE